LTRELQKRKNNQKTEDYTGEMTSCKGCCKNSMR
jgi:hypothetical protein